MTATTTAAVDGPFPAVEFAWACVFAEVPAPCAGIVIVWDVVGAGAVEVTVGIAVP